MAVSRARAAVSRPPRVRPKCCRVCLRCVDLPACVMGFKCMRTAAAERGFIDKHGYLAREANVCVDHGTTIICLFVPTPRGRHYCCKFYIHTYTTGEVPKHVPMRMDSNRHHGQECTLREREVLKVYLLVLPAVTNMPK